MWKNNVNLDEKNPAQFNIELNKRIRYALKNIDIAQILFNLNDIGGTLNLGKGGTGAVLAAPAADVLMFYDLSATAVDWLVIGSGITITDKTISVDTSSLSGVDADKLDGQEGSYYTDIVARLGYTPVTNARTVNSKALSANITLATSDINDSADKRYCTDAEKTVIGNTSNTNTGDETASTIKTTLGITGISGTFTTVDGKTITITDGLVTSIV